MKRNAIQKLIDWKESKVRLPIWILGVKGVGKTYLALDFAKSFYEGNLYVNFENNAGLREYVKKQITMRQNEVNLIDILCEYFQIPEELIGTLLIVLDEIDSCREAMNLLMDMLQLESNLSILVISSKQSISIDIINRNPYFYLYPIQFDEFLIALGQEWYAEVIKGHYQTNRKIPQIVHTELLTLFEDYLYVGGMPAAINEYISSDSVYNVAEIHKNIYQNFHYATDRNTNESEAMKMHQVLDVIVQQLMKENKKFQYRLIRKGTTYSMYKDAINSLVHQGCLLKSQKLVIDSNLENGNNSGSLELNNQDSTQFKLYCNDVGILYTLIQSEVCIDPKNEDQVRKALIENYTLQALTAKGYNPGFWESDSQAKVDFTIETKDGMIPIEAKTSDNTRSKSISIFKSQFSIPYSIKVSSRNYELSNGIKYIPYYALFCL